MANTYYDSQLTAAEIEAALEAIDGVIVPANNGKVLAISNGKLEARSVQWGGGEPVLEPLSVTANGDYTPASGVDGFDEVHVSVPNSYTASDEGKVVSNGALVAQTARASQITQNGTYDTTLNDEVTVNVSGGGSAVVQPLSVTQNGTYNPPSGVDGYAPVIVNVSGGGGDDWKSLKTYIQSSGTEYIDTGYVPNNDTEIEVVATVFKTGGTYKTIFGSRDSNQGNQVSLWFGNALYAWSAEAGVNGQISVTSFYTSKLLIKANRNKIYYVDSEETYAFGTPINKTLPQSSQSLFLFQLNQGGTAYGSATACIMKLYRFRAYENGTLVHEFIPWQDNGVACLKDTVTGNFKYNVGTGDFVYGTDS